MANPWPEEFRPKKPQPGSVNLGSEIELPGAGGSFADWQKAMAAATGSPGMPQGTPPVAPQRTEFSSAVDVSKGISSVFPQSKELDELYQRVEREQRRRIGSSETNIDPATGEIREYARNPETGEPAWFHYGVMPPPKIAAWIRGGIIPIVDACVCTDTSRHGFVQRRGRASSGGMRRNLRSHSHSLSHNLSRSHHLSRNHNRSLSLSPSLSRNRSPAAASHLSHHLSLHLFHRLSRHRFRRQRSQRQSRERRTRAPRMRGATSVRQPGMPSDRWADRWAAWLAWRPAECWANGWLATRSSRER